MKPSHLLCLLTAFLWLFTAQGCMKYGPPSTEDFSGGPSGEGVFITNQGNFMYANASLSYYIPGSKKMENNVFLRANGINLGDVAQSMTLYKGKGYIVVNNSGVVFVIDPQTFQLKGSITGLVSPRYIHFLDDTKAYITDLYAEKISIVDPGTLQITGSIPTPGHKSTEVMAQRDHLVFVTCWSYDNYLLVIDSRTDRLVDSLPVGHQPSQLLTDAAGMLWCAVQGGVLRIDPLEKKVTLQLPVSTEGYQTYIALNGTKDTLYYMDKDLWRMPIEDKQAPSRPFISRPVHLSFGLAADPVTSDVYIADALDYMQMGKVYRYNARGVPLDTLTTGVNPGFFCFK